MEEQAQPDERKAQPIVTANEPQPQNQPEPAEEGEVKQYVLGLVSEKTGYPSEMLDLNLDLEADLGIDTVKQAELFMALREKYNVPRPENLRLSDYNTLAKVIHFFALPGLTSREK